MMSNIADKIGGLSPEKQALLRQKLGAKSSKGSTAVNASLNEEISLDDVRKSVTDGHKPVAIDFSMYFFSNEESSGSTDKYRFVLDCAKYGDENAYKAIWIPERHFNKFGGLYSSPSALGGAIAAVTKNIRIRNGSVVSPINHPVRVAEQWSVVDNLSQGRVDLSFASGWQAEDFIFSPQNFYDKKDIMFRDIETVKRLWSGEKVEFEGVDRTLVTIESYPKPIQKDLNVWITTSGNVDTFIRAGEAGAHILTSLLGQSVTELAEKLVAYRKALKDNGRNVKDKKVTLMLHTFVGDELEAVQEKVREPIYAYLRSHMSLYENESMSNELNYDRNFVTEADKEALIRKAFQRFTNSGSLIGTETSCRNMLNVLSLAGVTEVGCLVDFGVDEQEVLDSLDKLTSLMEHHQSHFQLDA